MFKIHTSSSDRTDCFYLEAINISSETLAK